MHQHQNQDAAPSHDPEAGFKKKPDGERHNMGYDSMMVKFKNRQKGAMICRVVYTGDRTSKARHGEQGSPESGGFWGCRQDSLLDLGLQECLPFNCSPNCVSKSYVLLCAYVMFPSNKVFKVFCIVRILFKNEIVLLLHNMSTIYYCTHIM